MRARYTGILKPMAEQSINQGEIMTTKTATFKATREWPGSTWHTDMPFPAEVIAAGEWRGEYETQGPWHTLSSYRALAVEQTDENLDTSHYETYRTTAVIHGPRQLFNARESGYDLEGKVSINGEKLRAFTSTMMFEVDGKLVDVAIIYVCRK